MVIWSKLPGLSPSILWPVKIEAIHPDHSMDVFCRSDNAQ